MQASPKRKPMAFYARTRKLMQRGKSLSASKKLMRYQKETQLYSMQLNNTGKKNPSKLGFGY